MQRDGSHTATIAYTKLMTSMTPPLPLARDCCLFLDVDGTLLHLAPAPDLVVVDEPLRELLRSLERRCEGALALISGRPIAELDDLFDPLFLTAAGVHGCERRDQEGFSELKAKLFDELKAMKGLLIEDKQYALALHYRMAPALEVPLRTMLSCLAPSLPETLEVIEGDEVFEIKPNSHDKGTAIEAFLQEAPFAGRYPIFIGDDLTDQDGFAVIRRHLGLAIAVGSNVNSEWRLDGPDDVRRWLFQFLSRPH
jgi:trehalose 6-phosphate phosphatase